MLKLYKRLVRDCKTINQVNRIHIALENWMTPLQWCGLRAELLQSVNYEFLRRPGKEKPASAADIEYAQHKWLATLQEMFGKAAATVPQPFLRHRIRRHISLYKSADKASGAKTLAVCFTGIAQRMMVPLPVFLQHIEASNTDVAVISYPRGKGFRNGIEGVAASFEESVAALATILPLGQYARTVAIGVSGGGLPAVLTSLKLGFDAALSFSGGHPEDSRWSEALGFNASVLVRKFRQVAGKPQPIFLVFGADAEPDMEAANALAQLLPVKLVKVTGKAKPVGHVSMHPLLMTGKLSRFLEETVLGPGKAGPPVNGSLAPSAAAGSGPSPGSALLPLSGPRYFGIGFNKTGTTSLGRCFEALGLTPIAEPRSLHVDFRQLSRAVFERGDFGPALHAATYFRAFQDRPWNVWNMYQRLDEKFPGSYFILTERHPEVWWNSVERWLMVTHKNDKAKHLRYLHHLKVDRLEKSRFIDAYKRYNDEARSYFANRSNLLVMNLEAGDGWDKLCDFLDLPVPAVDFPHANKQRTANKH